MTKKTAIIKIAAKKTGIEKIIVYLYIGSLGFLF